MLFPWITAFFVPIIIVFFGMFTSFLPITILFPIFIVARIVLVVLAFIIVTSWKYFNQTIIGHVVIITRIRTEGLGREVTLHVHLITLHGIVLLVVIILIIIPSFGVFLLFIIVFSFVIIPILLPRILVVVPFLVIMPRVRSYPRKDSLSLNISRFSHCIVMRIGIGIAITIRFFIISHCIVFIPISILVFVPIAAFVVPIIIIFFGMFAM